MGWQDAPVVSGGATGWQSAPLAEPEKPAPVTDFSGNLRFGPIDTGIPLPQAINKGLAQLGSGFNDLVVGGSQLVAPSENNSAQAVDEMRKRNAQLNDTFTGKALNFAGNVLPTLAIPMGWAGALGRAAPVLEGLAVGAGTGALQPVGTGESRAANVAIGGAAGAALPAVVQGARVLSTPQDTTLAQKAIQQYGIPLGPADIADSKTVKGLRSILNDLPITGAMGASDKEAVQQGFNRAVGNTFGSNEPKLTAAVMDNAKGRIGQELDRIWNSNDLKIDGKFVSDLQAIQQRATNLNPEQAQAVNRQVQNLLQKVGPNGEVPGSFVNNWQSELRLAAEGEKGLHQSILSQLRKSAIDTFNRSVTGPDAQALTTARGQYAAFKAIEPLMNKAEAGVAGRVSGDVPAALLPAQVVSQYGNRVSQSPFADLSQIGGRFLVDRTPQTGGSVRALMQNAGVGALTGAGGLGAGIATGTLVPTAIGMGTAVGAQRLLGSPAAARMLLTAPQNRLGLLTTELGRLPIPVGVGLLGVQQGN